MGKRYVSIWFPYLGTDLVCVRRNELRDVPFVVCAPSHGRMIVIACNALAESAGIHKRMVLADARVLVHGLQYVEEQHGLSEKLLLRIAEWCIRFTPIASVDSPDGILLDATGCTHLWGGDAGYLTEITKRLKAKGYTARVAIAGTIGAAWAVARFGKKSMVIASGSQAEALLHLPAESMRIEETTVQRLNKLGLRQVKDFIGIPRAALRRRFGPLIIQRINQAAGYEEEFIQPVIPVEPFYERLPSLEPIVTITGIEIALRQLLEAICKRLRNEGKGLRLATFKCYRADGKIIETAVGTIRPSSSEPHLFKLFEEKLSGIEPGEGIELFTLDAPNTEEHIAAQEMIWEETSSLQSTALAELMDRVAGKLGAGSIRRYLPAEHYWPERSIELAKTLTQQLPSQWIIERPRPIQLLSVPEPVEVTAPVPDYPPMNFRYKGKLHKVIRADGPERIEQEWWLQDGQHRDYYMVEDEEGKRYWLFRSGHYTGDKSHDWFLHGFFA